MDKLYTVEQCHSQYWYIVADRNRAYDGWFSTKRELTMTKLLLALSLIGNASFMLARFF